MDPLSVAASAAGLMSLCIGIIDVVGDYYTSAKNARKDIQGLKSELEYLSTVLERLEQVLRSDGLRCNSFSFDTSSVLIAALRSCEKQIGEISLKLQRNKDSNASRILERLKWPFNEKEIQKLIELLRRYILTFQFSLTIEGCNILSKTSENVSTSLELQLDTSRKVYDLTKNISTMAASAQEASKLSEQVIQILKLVSTFQSTTLKLEEVCHDLRSLTKNSQDQRENRILDWLSTASYSQKHHDVRASRIPGTGQWLLYHAKFQAWLNRDAKFNVLLVVGDPGVGKSVLTSIIVDQLLERYNAGGAGIAYFYFDYRDPESQTPNQFLATLLRQLLMQKEAFARLLIEVYERCRKDRSQVTIADLMQVCKEIRSAFDDCFIVIDALDESNGKRHRKEISDILEDLELAKFKILITSRPHPQDIERRFHKALQIQAFASEEDIRNFCCSKIDGNEDIRELVDETLREDIISTMSKNAQGMFLLPVLQMQSIMDQMTKSEIRKCLRNLSTNLNQVFENSIRRINSEPQNRRQVAIQSLLWTTHARRPLHINELRHALAIRPGDTQLDRDNLLPPRSIVECCFGLVVLDNESLTVRLVHYTLQEHMMSLKTSLFPSGDSHVALISLIYLSFDSFIDPNIDQEDHDQVMERYPFLRYASFHWGHHANNARKDDEITDLTVKYLTNKPKRAFAKRIRDLESARLTQPCEDYIISDQGGGLLEVAYFGLEHLVEPIIRNGEDVNTSDSFGNTALHEAALNGHYAVAEALLRNRADVDMSNFDCNTPLFLAASRPQHDLLELLLGYQAGPDASCLDCWTPLHKASDSGQYLNVKSLLQHGANVFTKSARGLTALHRAAGRGHIGIVRLLLEHGATVDSRTCDSWTPLAGASSNGRHDVVKLLLERGARVNSFCDNGRTPLHRACRGGHRETVLILLGEGADSLAADNYGQVPLHWAAKGGHNAVAKILLHNSFSPLHIEDERGYTPQQEAFSAGHWETARFLKEEELCWRGTSPEKPDEMTDAIEKYDLGKAKELLLLGFDVNRRNSDGLTPLHQALQKNALDIGLALLQGGADIEARTLDGWGPLHVAARSGSEAQVKQCLEHGARYFLSTADGQTALHKACESGNIEIARLLIEEGSDVEATDVLGFTPLLTAATSGHQGIIKYLLEKDAEMDALSNDDCTIQDIAASAGHYEVVEFLRKQRIGRHINRRLSY